VSVTDFVVTDFVVTDFVTDLRILLVNQYRTGDRIRQSNGATLITHSRASPGATTGKYILALGAHRDAVGTNLEQVAGMGLPV
jgi:hypothetical protein